MHPFERYSLEYVSREVLSLLTAGARALLCPSISEGFGLPALEVCGDAATYVDPHDVSEIRRAVAAFAGYSEDRVDGIGKCCLA